VGSLLVAMFALFLAQRANRKSNVGRDQLVAIQKDMSRALQQIAQATQAQAGMIQTTSKADIFVQLVKPAGKKTPRLVMDNRGPGEAQIIDFQILGQPDILVYGDTDPRGMVLKAGENVSMLAAITFGTSLPLDVLVRWQDGEGFKDRHQKVGFSG